MSARDDALRIYTAAVEAVKPKQLIRSSCAIEGDTLRIGEWRYDLGRYRRLFLFGSGKAAGTMAAELEAMLKDRIDSGVVVVAPGAPRLQRVRAIEGSHPVPGANSVAAGRAIKAAMEACASEDLFIYLLSGGSSALMELPIEPIGLDELQELTLLMLRGGLDISRVNTVRKHVSAIKGGRLGASCRAEGVVLVVSDVIGDDLEAIGSAPLYCDRSTYADAKAILEEAKLFDAVPPSVRDVIERGCRGEIPESPKAPSDTIRHLIVGSNTIALQAAADEAVRLGYRPLVVSEPLQGDADAVAETVLARGRALSPKECLIYGGETTVDVKGSGRGGRNQQLCLRALSQFDKNGALTLLCAGSDGLDGNSDAAGAVIDQGSLSRAGRSGLDPHAYLEANDAYGFFEQTGDLVVTGPSGTNVMDVTILIRGAN